MRSRRIERVRVDAALTQRLQHRVAGQERDLALGRRAAQQHGNLSEVSRHVSSSRRASLSRCGDAEHPHLGLERDAGVAATTRRAHAQ